MKFLFLRQRYQCYHGNNLIQQEDDQNEESDHKVSSVLWDSNSVWCVCIHFQSHDELYFYGMDLILDLKNCDCILPIHGRDCGQSELYIAIHSGNRLQGVSIQKIFG